MFSHFAYRLRSISLVWKLLLPFLFFSFTGTTTLVYIGLTSQQDLIRKEEQKEIRSFYRLFLEKIDSRLQQALAMATTVAENSDVQQLLRRKDRQGLMELLTPLLASLKTRFGVLQFHLHIPPGISFLRLHLPEHSGEMLSYRKTIRDAMKLGKGVAGLEWGISGLGLRGIAPVFLGNELVGSVEIGFPFGTPFLADLKEAWGPDFSVYEKKGSNLYMLLATSLVGSAPFPLHDHLLESEDEDPMTLIAPEQYQERSILHGPVRDYYGEVVAQVIVEVNRSETIQRLGATMRLMVLVGLAGIAVSFLLTWVVVSLFTRPILEIVGEAQEIARGERERHLDQRPDDEIGELAQALNTMLDSLKQRRRQIEEYARTLEIRVRERTSDLVASEEKYRTLVENLPLIVYRLLEDGTTEFINSYFSQKLGYSTDEVVGDKNFWREKICGLESTDTNSFLGSCWRDRKVMRVERVVKNRHGSLHTFIDQAIPRKDENGYVQWIDGIMVDITELKRLQERAVRAEEIRVLGEISARFAHELRNPLATAGGFARRLSTALPEKDPNKKAADIIVKEVARLEEILRIILSSIEPFTLCVSELNMNALLSTLLEQLEEQILAKNIEAETSLSPNLPPMRGDEQLLTRAFQNLLRHAIITSPSGGAMSLSTSEHDSMVRVVIRHRMEGLSEEDLDQFFLPRVADREGTEALELPLSKIIIHRHGGTIDVEGDEEHVLTLSIKLPLDASAEGPGIGESTIDSSS